jgi:hypothetical protein
MKKIISFVIASFMFCNIGFAERAWVKTDYTISYYLKNDWALTFVNQKNDYKTVYTLQKSKSIISCRIEDMTSEKCFKPVGQK